MMSRTIGEVGEKAIIQTIIRPLLNPTNDPNSIGDDAAVIRISNDRALCISTDRVPADLISFRLGIIDHEQLGYYLAVLNLSDLAAMGADPIGLLLNLGLPHNFGVDTLVKLLSGARTACGVYGCEIIGGDMSAAPEMSISATSIGSAEYERLLRRAKCELGDSIFCSGVMGLTSTAFHYYLIAKPMGLRLCGEFEQLLADQFRKPVPRFDVARRLRDLPVVPICMDNTDGAGQTLLELAQLNGLSFVIDESELPIHSVTHEVADFLHRDVIDVALGAGADFNLLGTIPIIQRDAAADIPDLRIIGDTEAGSGLWLRNPRGRKVVNVVGWNYFTDPPLKISTET